ncbi:hypothetical protein GQ53DRAFT_220426 [Thozetella sp. PMI_491]|nr:hypothetical protein GQ53DRAFT_220426 [Thozetella sp. PMI_491]
MAKMQRKSVPSYTHSPDQPSGDHRRCPSLTPTPTCRQEHTPGLSRHLGLVESGQG